MTIKLTLRFLAILMVFSIVASACNITLPAPGEPPSIPPAQPAQPSPPLAAPPAQPVPAEQPPIVPLQPVQPAPAPAPAVPPAPPVPPVQPLPPAPAPAQQPTTPQVVPLPPAPPPPLPGDPGVATQPFVVWGTVTDSRGNPLTNSNKRVGGTTRAGERTSFDTATDRNGRYRIQVPDGIYHVRAWHNVQYQGSTYTMLLHPADNETRDFEASQGLVKHFVWKVSGVTASASWKTDPKARDVFDHYGSGIKFYFGRPPTGDVFARETPWPAGASIQITLRPEGALIDGSQSKELQFTQPYTTGQNQLMDIPTGQYNISAIMVTPEGVQTPLLVGRQETGQAVQFSPSLLFTFPPHPGARNLMDMGGTDPVTLYFAQPIAPTPPAVELPPPAPAVGAPGPSLTGTYRGSLTVTEAAFPFVKGQASLDLNLKDTGSMRLLSGAARSQPPAEGEGPIEGQVSSGNKLHFKWDGLYWLGGMLSTVTFDGVAEGNTLKGTFASQSGVASGTWQVSRVAGPAT